MTKKPIALPPDFVEERSRRFLLVWGDAPHWMVADEDVLSLVRLADGTRTVEQLSAVANRHPGAGGEDALSATRGVIAQLGKAGVLHYGSLGSLAGSRKPMLENITINITRRCNLRCTHCFLGGGAPVEEMLEVGDLARFLREGRGYISPNTNFALLGGEPLLDKPKALAIAALARERGNEVTISTNGLLVDDEFAHRVAELGVLVQVSIEGSTAEINDAVRGKGSFSKAVRGVEALVEARAHTILSMVVHRSNIADIDAYYALSEQLGTTEVRYIPLTLMGGARTGGLEPVRPVELMRALQGLLERRPTVRVRMRRDYLTILRTVCSRSNRRAYCGTGLKTILIDADGETYPCPNHQRPEFRCGNVREKSFREIWLGSPVLRRVRSTYDIDQLNDECASCPVRYWCMGGCRGETFESTRDMRSRPVRCEELREAVIEMMWSLGTEGSPPTEPERLEYF